MGSGFSGETSGGENKNIVKWLLDCGFVSNDGQPVGDFISQLHESQQTLGEFMLDSFLKKKNTKGAIGASTNANIRFMQEILGIWEKRYPGKPLPNQIKRQILRLSCLIAFVCFSDVIVN